MRNSKKILLLLLSSLLFSCVNQQQDKTELDISDTVKILSMDGFYIDENEVNSNEWKEYESESTINKSSFQIELENAVNNESIDSYYKEIFENEKLISADDNKMLSITDSIFTKNPETDLFYFIVFTKSMNGADGFYSEGLGVSALDFITKKTKLFANYFNNVPKLTNKDMDNWAYCVYGEIQISREGEELQGIKELESAVLKNVEKARKGCQPVIERFLEKIKKVHNDC